MQLLTDGCIDSVTWADVDKKSWNHTSFYNIDKYKVKVDICVVVI